MQLCAGKIVPEETFNSKQESREYDQTRACRALALTLVGKGKEANVEAMITTLQREQGTYLATIFEKHARELLPKIDPEQISRFSDVLRKIDLRPQLVVANVVENTFGSLEAARYALALLKAIANDRLLTGTLRSR
jgi:hypothetical protein